MILVTDLTEAENNLRKLRNLLPVGTTVYTTETQVGRTLTSRVSVFIPRNMGQDGLIIQDINFLASQATGNKLSYGKFALGGCGYSKSFHTVYSIGRALFPEGFGCIGEGCPSNDHSNGHPRDGVMHHSDGGYALRQSGL